ncbi:SGNH/GDSL hydrolase family protein [Pedobacter chinensis]|uniref:SGNH/GDSL hydrolase family protein n=1 Tax=Pedobacter chinensis TaxID=2282421 RepID=A0A369PZ26_9SPHI|nr:SGNH/GDSL hydrolase family protein [Pedobacter chinensis]RDC56006.1 SGNH/GDSL hydrolase family protein [Pedobacter chinensis]
MVTNKIGMKAILLGCLLISTMAFSQESADRDKIAASQTGASPIYFALAANIPKVEPGNYTNEQECIVRAGLPRFFAKVNSGKEVVVAFIGGSITQSDFGYRLQTASYMEQTYTQAKFRWINAGVSGTGTELGAFRIQEHVLNHRPDLIFIEFAVNGAYPDGMEGMIRQTIKLNPDAEICLIYTILNGQSAFYQKKELPPNIIRLEQLAAYYELPSVNLGMEASSLEASEKLIWKGSSQTIGQHQILFSEDGIHPTIAGGNLYAAAIARAFKKIGAAKQLIKGQLPKPLITSAWDEATMVDPSILAIENNGWQLIPTAANPNLKKFSPWFPNVLTANKPGASFSFRFKGDTIGIFDIGGPEVGQLEWHIDGKPVKLSKEKQGSFSYYQATNAAIADALNRFNAFCNNRYRGQFDVIKVPAGEHVVTCNLSGQQADKLGILPEDKRADIVKNPEKYNQTVIYLGRILLRGSILK